MTHKPNFRLRAGALVRKSPEKRTFIIECSIRVSDKVMIAILEDGLKNYFYHMPHEGVYHSTLHVKSGSKVKARQKGLRTELRKLRGNPVVMTSRAIIDDLAVSIIQEHE